MFTKLKPGAIREPGAPGAAGPDARTILMADVIRSRTMDQARLIADFSRLCDAANRTFRARLESPLTITLGDEFQCVPDSWLHGVELILHLEEESIRRGLGFRMRYVLVRGLIETPINRKIGYGMLGSGLTHARELLQGAKKSTARFRLEGGPEPGTTLLNRLFVVYSSLRDAWRPAADFPLVASFLDEEDYRTVARQHGKNPSQIWKRRRSLQIVPYLALRQAVMEIAALS